MEPARGPPAGARRGAGPRDAETGQPSGGAAPRDAESGAADRREPGGRERAFEPLHRRHMPMEPLKFHIPRKTREQRALFQFESRECEDMLSIVTSSYRDTASSSCFTYSQPRLVHNELLEKEFVEKRREMKMEGRTEKELEENYCFLLSDTVKLSWLCEKGLLVGHSWMSSLGNPSKGVYLSKYSDLLQINPFSPGDTGEIVIFKVLKGKVKSIYENMSKNLLDPTPRFDSHVSKNISKVTSLNAFRAFELTQQYFYEYLFDELRLRPRQLCPYAVVSFLFKGKDAPPPSAPLRLNSQPEASKERAQFTVWSGDLVKGEQLLAQLSFLSSSPPFLPTRLPDKLEIGLLMSLSRVTKLLPSSLFSWNLYVGSHEVVKSGWFCSLLEVIDRQASSSILSKLLLELEEKKLILVNPLSDRGFLFLLSSVQMAPPSDRSVEWKRCLQALFVFPESREVAKSVRRCPPSSPESSVSPALPLLPRIERFLPALHQALLKVRANPPAELCAGVERQAEDYLAGRRDGTGRDYLLAEYDTKLDQRGKLHPAPKQQQLNVDGYLRSYLYSPALYLLSVGAAARLLEMHCGPQEPPTKRSKRRAKDDEREEVEDTAKKKRLQSKGNSIVRSAFLADPRKDRTGVTLEGNSIVRSAFLADPRKDRTGATLQGLNQGTSAPPNHSVSEEQGEEPGESRSSGRPAAKLALPTNREVDLRRQEELEAGSDMEGFSPSSHYGESTPKGEEEVEEIPWVLIPITGLRAERSGARASDLPRDPRLHSIRHNATAASPPGMATPSPPTSDHTCPANEPYAQANEDQLPPPAPRGSTDGAEHREELYPSLGPGHPERGGEENRVEEGVKEGRRAELMEVIEIEESDEDTEEERDALAPPSASSPLLLSPDMDCVALPPVSSPPLLPLDIEAVAPPPAPTSLPDIDDILQQQLGDFSSDIQHLLLEENMHYTSGRARHTHPAQHTLTGFSQYVSFFSGHVPVQDYVSSLREGVSSILHDALVSYPLHQHANASTANTANRSVAETSAMLANSISDFLAGMRATAGSSRTSDTVASGDEASLSPDLRSSSGGLRDRDPPRVTSCDPSHPSHHPWCPASTRAVGLSPQCESLQDVGTSTSSRLSDTECQVNIPGLGGGYTPPLGPSQPVGAEVSAPPPTAISSLINRLQPEVFSSLVEIIKDVRKNSTQFYIHSMEPDDQIHDDIKEHLLAQGFVEQNPLTFLEQEASEEKLLVVIQNKHIAAHIHKVPGLVSLKRRSSVVFVGVESVEDLKNSSYNELFTSGGSIVSDEFVLNPDFITHERLASVLMFLEQQSSTEGGVWRWRVHCKTQKKLKEQARFKRDAASLLDTLSAFHKRLRVEFLPYHHCDQSLRQAPDLDCLLDLQARYTQDRHLIFLTERRFEMFPKFSSSGIIIANVDDIMHNFNSLVGYHGNKSTQPDTSDLAPAKEAPTLPALPHPPAPPSELSPGLPPAPPSDQLVPDSSSSSSSSNEGLPTQSDADFEALRFAISRFRAERRARAQQQQQRGLNSLHPNPAPSGGPVDPGRSATPPAGQRVAAEGIQLTPSRKAMAATLEWIHSGLEPGGGEALPGATVGEEPVSGRPGAGEPGVGPSRGTNESADRPAAPAEVRVPPSRPAGSSRGSDEAPAPEPGGAPAGPKDVDKVTSAAAARRDAQEHLHPLHQCQLHHLPRHPLYHPGSDGLLPCPANLPRLPNPPFSQTPMLGSLAAMGGMGGFLGPGGLWPGGLGPTGAAVVWGIQQAGMEFPGLMGSAPHPGGPVGNPYRGGRRGGL